MSDKSTPRDVQEAIEESQLKIIAQLKITGLSNEEIAKQLNITNYRVRRIIEQDEFKSQLREIADKMISTAAGIWKGSMSEMIPLALKVLEKALQKGDLEAVKIIVRTLGVEKTDVTNTGGALTVVLPDFKQEKAIEVINEEK